MVKFDTSVMTHPILKRALDVLQEQYKEYDIIGPVANTSPVPSIRTGSLSLDRALGIGGIPRGRVTLIAGDPATGKSTLCLSIIKNMQETDPTLLNLYVDMEAGAFTDEYAYNMGLDLDPNKFLIIRPEYAEQGFVAINSLISTGMVGVCVWDSIAGAYTKESSENTAEDNDSRAGQARLLSSELRKLAAKCGKTGTALVLVNQIRTQMTMTLSWSDITGGRAQKFYSSVRIDLAKKDNKPKSFDGRVDREEIIAHITKNKVAVPYKEAKFDIKFGQGILAEANTLDIACDEGLVAKGGAGWFTFFDLRTGEELAKVQTKAAATDWLIDNPEYRDALEQRILGYIREDEYEQEECTIELAEADE